MLCTKREKRNFLYGCMFSVRVVDEWARDVYWKNTPYSDVFCNTAMIYAHMEECWKPFFLVLFEFRKFLKIRKMFKILEIYTEFISYKKISEILVIYCKFINCQKKF